MNVRLGKYCVESRMEFRVSLGFQRRLSSEKEGDSEGNKKQNYEKSEAILVPKRAKEEGNENLLNYQSTLHTNRARV